MIIDAYQHLGMPRFQTVDDAIGAMDAAGIDKAVICPFETCPDLATVHRAMRLAPHRFLGLGIPIGRDRSEIEVGVRAQFAAGFAGLRLSGTDVRDDPWLLDLIGESGGIALVCGSGGLADGARNLLRFLADYPSSPVVGGHFAGPTDPAVFQREPALAELYGHERFLVVLSRQTLFDPGTIAAWSRELVSRVGWSRLLWGSEAPVNYWRDESMAEAMSWSDRLRPDHDAFFGGNAQRLLIDRTLPPLGRLQLPFDPLDLTVIKPAAMWAHGLDLDAALCGRLVHGWFAWGGSKRGPLRDYLATVLHDALPTITS